MNKLKHLFQFLVKCKLHRPFAMMVKNRGLVLKYHHIAGPKHKPYFAFENRVSSDLFEQQMRHLAKECDVVSLDELINTEKSRSLRPKVAITFDDGYLDNFLYAVPVLEKYKLPATFFICTDALRDPSPYLGDRLKTILFHHGISSLIPVYRELIDNNYESLDNEQILLRIRHWMENHKEGPEYLEGLENKLLNNTPTPFPFMRMGKSEVQALTQKGFDIGAHTVTHRELDKLSQSEVFEEMKNSKDILEKLIQKQVSSFCYPRGKDKPEYQKVAQEVGFRSVCRSQHGFTYWNEKNPLALSRYEGAADIASFVALTHGIGDLFVKLFKKEGC